MFPFRTLDGKEVGYVLEQPNEQLAGIEIKTTGQASKSPAELALRRSEVCLQVLDCPALPLAGELG
jgi:hypothetical protein